MLALFRAVLVDMRQYSEGSLESARAVIRKGTRMVQPAKSQDFLNSLWDRGEKGVREALEVGASFKFSENTAKGAPVNCIQES